MLVMFRFKNYASFENEIILDMRAVAFKNMKSHIIDNGRNKVVKTLALFGKNASGKSNLISAFYYFKSFIYNQFFASNHDDQIADSGDRMLSVKRNTFKLSDKKDNESEFEIIFFHNQKTFQYGFTIYDIINEREQNVIKEEWLLVDDKTVFERNGLIIHYGKKFEDNLKGIDRVRDDRLYIGALDYFAQGDIKTIIDSFKDYIINHFIIHFEFFLEGSIKGLGYGLHISNSMFTNPEYRNTVEKFLKIADIGIAGISLEKTRNEKLRERQPYEIKTIHNVYDEKGNVVGIEKFSLNWESSGTLRYLSFIQYILSIIQKGGVFIVDELSARLHPILTKFIIDLFLSDSNQNAQLIFTTHDVILMDRRQLRRDEIGFVEKDALGISSLYTLADIRARSDSSFLKDYLSGKYGAIPIIDKDFISNDMGDD